MSTKTNRTTSRIASRGRGLRLLMAVAATALVLPVAACQKGTGGAINPEKLAVKDAVSAAGSANMDIQSVSITMPPPSLDTQASNDAMIAATSSYAYAVILFDELIQAGESGDYSTQELEAMLAQVRIAYQEAEVQVRVAAAALQEELGSNWRDLDLLEPIDLEDDGWATAALGPATPEPVALGGAVSSEPAAFTAEKDDDGSDDGGYDGWGEDGGWEGGWGDDDQWGDGWGDTGSSGDTGGWEGDFAVGKIPPGSFMSMNAGGVGQNGERVVDATVVPPGATSDQTLERATAAGLDPLGTYVDVAIEQNDRDAVLHSLERLRDAYRSAGSSGSGQGVGALGGEALVSAVAGTYNCYIPEEDTYDTLAVSSAGGGNIHIVFDPEEPPRLLTSSGSGTFQMNLSAQELNFFGATADGTFTFTVTDSGVEATGVVNLRSGVESESHTYYCDKSG